MGFITSGQFRLNEIRWQTQKLLVIVLQLSAVSVTCCLTPNLQKSVEPQHKPVSIRSSVYEVLSNRTWSISNLLHFACLTLFIILLECHEIRIEGFRVTEFRCNSVDWDSCFNNTLSAHADVETHKAQCEIGLQSHIFRTVFRRMIVKYQLASLHHRQVDR